MVAQFWEPGTWYDLGSVVQFQGQTYKIIQAHRSQGDWTPPNVPALWGRYDSPEDVSQQGFYQAPHQGPSRPQWVPVTGKDIPNNAIEGGRDTNGAPLYIARAFYEGGVHLGKAGRHLRLGGVIGYGNKEIELDRYELLVGDQNSVRWVSVHDELHIQTLGGQPVDGGREADGNALYIAQATYKNGTHPGKTNSYFKGAVIPYGGKEEIIKSYNVLVYA